MNSAPLPESQLKAFLNYLTAPAAHSGQTALLLTVVHIFHQAFAKLKVLWSGRTSHLITSPSHVYPIVLEISPPLVLSMYWC